MATLDHSLFQDTLSTHAILNDEINGKFGQILYALDQLTHGFDALTTRVDRVENLALSCLEFNKAIATKVDIPHDAYVFEEAEVRCNSQLPS